MIFITAGEFSEMVSSLSTELDEELLWFESDDEVLEEVEVCLHVSKGILYVSLGEYGEPTSVRELRIMLAEVSDKDISVNFDTAEILYAASRVVTVRESDYGIVIGNDLT